MITTQHPTTGVLFDLDGVLLDTEGIYTTFWDAIDKAYPTHVPNFTQKIKGSNMAAILNTYFKREDWDDIFSKLDDMQRDMRYEFFPYAQEFLQQLHEAGIKMCIVTSSDQKKMDAVYRQHPGFRELFDDVIVGEMVHHPKPDPECFLLGASKLGLDIKDCYVFEDSINGLQAAMASGATVIGLATTNPREALAGKAQLIIDNFKDFTVSKMLSVKRQ